MVTVSYWSRRGPLASAYEGWTGISGRRICPVYRYGTDGIGAVFKVTKVFSGQENANYQTVQALAAVGQCRLMSLWDNLFSHLRVPVAQILLTRNDIADVSRRLVSLSICMLLLSSMSNTSNREPNISAPKIPLSNYLKWVLFPLLMKMIPLLFL